MGQGPPRVRMVVGQDGDLSPAQQARTDLSTCLYPVSQTW